VSFCGQYVSVTCVCQVNELEEMVSAGYILKAFLVQEIIKHLLGKLAWNKVFCEFYLLFGKH